MPSQLYFTYNQIHEDVKNLARKAEQFNADIIIAIGGGGLIPARILQIYIKQPIYTVTLQSYASDRISNKINVQQWLDNPSVIENKRVLIVDEIHDSGSTLAYCIRKVRKSNPSAVGVAVVHWKEKVESIRSQTDIEYYVGRYVPDKWVVYPWEKEKGIGEQVDDVVLLRKEMKEEFDSVNKTLRCLTESINTLAGSCSRMDGHIEFVEGVYTKLSSPLEFMTDNINKIRGIET